MVLTLCFSISNVASTIHFEAFDLMVDKSALCPKIRDNACNKMDFPEPVSPVSIDKPLSKETSKSSISEKFLIERESSTVVYCQYFKYNAFISLKYIKLLTRDTSPVDRHARYKSI